MRLLAVLCAKQQMLENQGMSVNRELNGLFESKKTRKASIQKTDTRKMREEKQGIQLGGYYTRTEKNKVSWGNNQIHNFII